MLFFSKNSPSLFMVFYSFLPAKIIKTKSYQAAAVMVFAEGSSNPAHPMLVGNAASQGARPRSCGRTLCLSTTPPSPARRPASTSQSPWARVVFQHQLLRQLVITNNDSTLVRKTRQKKNDTCPVRPHIVCKSILLWKSYERPSRLTHN